MKKEQRLLTIFFTIMILLSATGGCVLAETEKVSPPEVKPSDLAIQVDFSKPAGLLKPLHGVNGGPRAVGRHTGDMVTLHKQAGFPSVRLHDCNWPHPDVVDIPTIFPLFHLYPDDPKNYQFVKTDAYIKPIIDNGASIDCRSKKHIESSREAWKIKRWRDKNKWVPEKARQPGQT